LKSGLATSISKNNPVADLTDMSFESLRPREAHDLLTQAIKDPKKIERFGIDMDRRSKNNVVIFTEFPAFRGYVGVGSDPTLF